MHIASPFFIMYVQYGFVLKSYIPIDEMKLLLRHTFCTRLLLAVVPSWMYLKDLTLHTLLESIARDIKKLEDEGLKATSCLKDT